MPTPPYFLGCDWGTSSFRLRLVERSGMTVLDSVESDQGVKAVQSKSGGLPHPASPAERDEAFAGVLLGAIEELAGRHAECRSAPVVISGMASSNMGWKVLPYGSVPCGLDGSGLRVEELPRLRRGAGSVEHRVWLVSGLSSGRDIMRGEESEILGIFSLPEMAEHQEDALLVLPGTHAKHVRILDRRLVDFRTFMTGELLELLSTRSLLAASVEWPPAESSNGFGEAFAEGVRTASDAGLARGLFLTRVRTVLDEVAKGPNSAFLAGLLIGAELADLGTWGTSAPVVLAASRRFSFGYRRAAEELGLGPRLVVLAPERLLQATLRAQALILDRCGRDA